MSSSMGVVVSVKGAAAEKIMKAVQASTQVAAQKDAMMAKSLMESLNKK